MSCPGLNKIIKKTVPFVFVRAAVLLAPATAYAIEFDNPIGSDTFSDFLTTVLDGTTPVAETIAVVAIVFAGFQYVTAAGNQEKIKKAKIIFAWAVVGAAIIVGASAIAKAIINSLN